MIIKNNKILKVSAIATILSIGLLSAGYTLANKNITLVVKGKETEISTLKSNVEDVLAEQNVKYDKNDIISLPLDQKISDGDKIEVIKVTEKTIKENKEVPFEVNIVEDKDLLKGDTKVEVEGQPGNNELLYKITYHNAIPDFSGFAKAQVNISNMTDNRRNKVAIGARSQKASPTEHTIAIS